MTKCVCLIFTSYSPAEATVSRRKLLGTEEKVCVLLSGLSLGPC